jgi:hypothetical protein
MAFEERNGRLYYYRKVREDGRVRSEYVGSGEAASLWAAMTELDRADRESERAVRRADQERERAEEREVSDWFERIEAVADAAMFAAGFHRHKGQWRRRRHG